MKTLYRLRWRPSGAVMLVATFLLIGIFVLVALAHNQRAYRAQLAADAATVRVVRSIQPDDHVIGNQDAPIQVIVYNDYSCPYCKTFHESDLPRLLGQYPDIISVVYRNFPLTLLHPRAMREAEAAECVSALRPEDSRYFWFFVRNLYSVPDEQLESGVDDETLATMAEDVGLGRDEFLACLSSGATRERVQRDVLEGLAFGVSKTPSAIVKLGDTQVLVSGATFRKVQAAINLKLAEKLTQ